jgi:protein-S-isoprenylcysteine O-methyltransferase Ste14
MAIVETDNKMILVKPPILYAAGLAVGFAAEHFIPTHLLDPGWSGLFGFAFIGLGLFVGALAFIAFNNAGVPIPHWKMRNKLVQEGIFNMTRNPFYVGLTCIFGGIGLAANNLWVLGLLLVILPIMHYGVVKREEAFLAQRFGDEYSKYIRHVRRWI